MYLNQIEVIGVALALFGAAGAVAIAVAHARGAGLAKHEMRMGIRDYLSLRDVVLRDEILAHFPESQAHAFSSELDDAIAKTDAKLRQKLIPSLFDMEEAKLFQSISQHETT